MYDIIINKVIQILEELPLIERFELIGLNIIDRNIKLDK